MGYHKAKIDRGTFGNFSKIKEEFEELQDAAQQYCRVMMLCEMADLIGAMEGYLQTHCPGITLEDILRMKQVTANAFKDGTRKSKE